MVEQRLRDSDQHDRDRLLAEAPVGGGVDVHDRAGHEALEQGVDTHVHRGHDEDEPEKVDPGRGPSPSPSTQDRRPVIEAAGGRVGRADLAQRRRDHQREHAADQPADRRLETASRRHREREGRYAAGQDADDRERDGEVGEAAHPARQFLGVAHGMQGANVVVVDLGHAVPLHRCGVRHGCTPVGPAPLKG